MNRIDAILTNPDFINHIEKIAAKEVDRKFCRHDMQHMVDTARITYILSLEDDRQNPDYPQSTLRELVYAAGLLHDIGRWVEYETGENHALVSAEMAIDILTKAGFDVQERAIICQAIREHRGGNLERSVLGAYLYKADKLARPCLECQAKGECYKYVKMVENRGLLEY